MGEPCRPTNDRYGCLTHKQELGKCVEALQAEADALRSAIMKVVDCIGTDHDSDHQFCLALLNKALAGPAQAVDTPDPTRATGLDRDGRSPTAAARPAECKQEGWHEHLGGDCPAPPPPEACQGLDIGSINESGEWIPEGLPAFHCPACPSRRR